jgi:hemolysin III
MMTAAASPRLPAERWADLCILVCGLFLGTAGAVALLVAAFVRRDTRLLIGVAIYAAGLLAMLGSSLAFHAAAGSPRRWLFRRFDHAGIFAMIAGTATPFALSLGDAILGSAATAAVWAGAAIGIVVKLRSSPTNARQSVIPYLILGWVCAVALVPSVSPATGLQLAAGGVLYTVGVIFYLWRRLPFHSAIWHAFVLAGAACHYLAIVDGVVIA